MKTPKTPFSYYVIAAIVLGVWGLGTFAKNRIRYGYEGVRDCAENGANKSFPTGYGEPNEIVELKRWRYCASDRGWKDWRRARQVDPTERPLFQ